MSWCWHNWTWWKTYKVEGVKRIIENGQQFDLPFSATKQARQCAKCRLEQHRTISNAGGSTYDNF